MPLVAMPHQGCITCCLTPGDFRMAKLTPEDWDWRCMVCTRDITAKVPGYGMKSRKYGWHCTHNKGAAVCVCCSCMPMYRPRGAPGQDFLKTVGLGGRKRFGLPLRGRGKR